MENRKNRYHKSKVYKLFSPLNEYYYIGSTCSSLSHRLATHKQNNKINSLKKWIEETKPENIRIVLISRHNVETKDELKKIEHDILDKCRNNQYCLNYS
jgi:Uri superfamily endonuclease